MKLQKFNRHKLDFKINVFNKDFLNICIPFGKCINLKQ